MARLLFEKLGNSVWISHLDLMRLFQRAFKRAGLPLKHTQGFNPRPSVSIALPLSVGVESHCELLDFELEGEAFSNDEICRRLNDGLVEGIRVLSVIDSGRKIRDLCYLDCKVILEYDQGVPEGAEAAIRELLSREEVMVSKKTKRGEEEQNIVSMIQKIDVEAADRNALVIIGRICCQNPTLNPMQIVHAIENYIPKMKPDHSRVIRTEILDKNQHIFR